MNLSMIAAEAHTHATNALLLAGKVPNDQTVFNANRSAAFASLSSQAARRGDARDCISNRNRASGALHDTRIWSELTPRW